MFESIDWNEVFGLTMSPLELVVRGSAMFWFLFALFRFVLRREVGSVAMADVLIFVIIADAAQNAMSGEYKSVTDGMILVGTIVAWNLLVDWLAYRSSWLRRVLEPPLLVVVRDGRINRRALSEQRMTIEDLKAKLREHEVEHVSEVKLATFESNGDFSVLKRRKKSGKPPAH